MKFAIVELATGMVIRTGRDFEKLRRKVEEHQPSRWDNPVLVVIPEGYRPLREEGEIPPGYVSDHVVAVPTSGWGYGAKYVHLVNRNRRRFGLPGRFEPPEEMLDVIRFRSDITDFGDFLKKRPLIDDVESAEKLEQSGELISKLQRLKEKKEIEETPEWAREVLEEKQRELEEAPAEPYKPDDILTRLAKWKRKARRLVRPLDEQVRRGEISWEEYTRRVDEIHEQLEEEFGPLG